MTESAPKEVVVAIATSGVDGVLRTVKVVVGDADDDEFRDVREGISTGDNEMR